MNLRRNTLDDERFFEVFAHKNHKTTLSKSFLDQLLQVTWPNRVTPLRKVTRNRRPLSTTLPWLTGFRMCHVSAVIRVKDITRFLLFEDWWHLTAMCNCILNGLFLTVFLCLEGGQVRCIHSIRPFYVNFVSWFGCLSYNSMHRTVVIGQRGVQDQDVDASSHPSVFAHFTATSWGLQPISKIYLYLHMNHMNVKLWVTLRRNGTRLTPHRGITSLFLRDVIARTRDGRQGMGAPATKGGLTPKANNMRKYVKISTRNRILKYHSGFTIQSGELYSLLGSSHYTHLMWFVYEFVLYLKASSLSLSLFLSLGIYHLFIYSFINLFIDAFTPATNQHWKHLSCWHNFNTFPS